MYENVKKRHQQKIRDMKCSVDNKSPFQPTHLKTKAKKNALMEERFTQIETENRLLLEKMSHIMRVRKFLALQIAIGEHVF
mmetsp:Transcript_16977/g.24183  ORF Transcript_16977/g.24183 Transcript_16977/m.24183 type:complete len:81 (+) Transcript_16977:112-354(+)